MPVISSSTLAAPRSSAGFTAVELLLALSLAGIIGLCVFSMTSAASQVWRSQEMATSAATSGGRAQSYIERVLRSAQDVGYWSAGAPTEPAAVLLWAHDEGSQQPDAQRDHQVQKLELVLIRYDAAAKKIKLFRAREWTAMTSGEQALASETVSSSDFALRDTADAFATATWVQEFVMAGTGGEMVTAAWCSVDRTAENPVVRFRFTTLREQEAGTISGTVSLRIRDSADDWSRTVLERSSDAGGSDPGDEDPFEGSGDLFP